MQFCDIWLTVTLIYFIFIIVLGHWTYSLPCVMEYSNSVSHCIGRMWGNSFDLSCVLPITVLLHLSGQTATFLSSWYNIFSHLYLLHSGVFCHCWLVTKAINQCTPDSDVVLMIPLVHLWNTAFYPLFTIVPIGLGGQLKVYETTE